MITDTVFRGNTAGAAAGAVALTSHTPLTAGDARTRAVLEGLHFEGNAADSCGAVALVEEMAAELVLRNVSASGNAARGGRGGVLCVAPGAPAFAASLGRTVALGGATLNGDLSLVAPGVPVPISAPFSAAWAIAAFPACVVALTVSDYAQYPGEAVLEQRFNVTDIATGRVLLDWRERPAPWDGPYEAVSTAEEGLLVTYEWAGVYPASPTRTFTTGFLASWSTLCRLSGGGAFASNETAVVMDGLRAWGNSAERAPDSGPSGDGGVAFVDLAAGYAGKVAAALTLRGCSLWNNRAASRGGGLLVSGNVALRVEDSSLSDSAAGGGAGGCVALDAAASAKFSRVNFTRCVARGLRRGSGGAVGAQRTAVEAEDSAFDACEATADGGAVFLSDSPALSLSRCTFTGNAAQGPQSRGGAVAVLNSSAVALLGCSFRGNRVAREGDASDESSALALLRGEDELVRFRAGDGGALYLSAPVLGGPGGGEVNDDDDDGGGGGDSDSDSDSDTSGAQGGAPPAAAELTLCVFEDGSARMAGGGVALWGSALVLLDRCAFRNTSAGSAGGGVAAGLGAQLTLRETSFSACTAGGGAGAAGSQQQAAAVAATASASAAAAQQGTCSCSAVAASASGGALWLGPGSANATLTVRARICKSPSDLPNTPAGLVQHLHASSARY